MLQLVRDFPTKKEPLHKHGAAALGVSFYSLQLALIQLHDLLHAGVAGVAGTAGVGISGLGEEEIVELYKSQL